MDTTTKTDRIPLSVTPARKDGKKAGEIQRILDRVQAIGRRPSEIFEDWLSMVVATLEAIPTRFMASVQGQEFVDTEETVTLFNRLRDRYRARYGDNPAIYYEMLIQAFSLLLDSIEDGYHDTLGEIYMNIMGGQVAGQFFTPMDIAAMMAEMTLDGAAKLVQDRLYEAICKSPAATAMLLAGMIVPEEQQMAWMRARVIPHAIEHYQPVTVYDPCCGSGVMFLAAASKLPPWMVQLGLVQFSGQDISHICTQMAKANMMLYGLNGFHAAQIVFECERELVAGLGAEIVVVNEGELLQNSNGKEAAERVHQSVTQLSLFPSVKGA